MEGTMLYNIGALGELLPSLSDFSTLHLEI